MKNCVLLVDFNNLLFRTLHARDVYIKSEIPSWALWRFLVYDAVYQGIKNNENVMEVVLAIDDKNHWRKAYWKRYKESRKDKRDKTGLDWGKIFGVIKNYTRDIKHHMPFKVLKIRSAEADDIIAVISKDVQKQTDRNIVISSNDEDYIQLLSDRIKLWNPSKRNWAECDDPKDFLLKKLLTGQPKDDIFNVKTPDDWGLTEETKGKRKPGLGLATANKIINEGYKEWLEKNNLQDNFKRNKILIDFNYIPKTIQNRVLNAYHSYTYPPPKNIYPFFKKYKMRAYLKEFNTVEKYLLNLYDNIRY